MIFTSGAAGLTGTTGVLRSAIRQVAEILYRASAETPKPQQSDPSAKLSKVALRPNVASKNHIDGHWTSENQTEFTDRMSVYLTCVRDTVGFKPTTPHHRTAEHVTFRFRAATKDDIKMRYRSLLPDRAASS